EQDRRPDLAQLLRIEALDRPLRSHGHEDRRGDVSVRGMEDPRTRLAVPSDDLEAHRPASANQAAITRAASASADGSATTASVSARGASSAWGAGIPAGVPRRVATRAACPP